MIRHLPLALMFAALSLAACAPRTFQAEVTRFHAIEAPIKQGTLIAIEPMGLVPKDDAFHFLAARLGEGLASIGFKPAEGQVPDVIVRSHFLVTTSREPRDDSAGRFGIGVGGGPRGSSVGIGADFNTQLPPVTLQNRQLVVTMEDAQTGTRLFEGRVDSQGQGTDTDKILPVMIKALLADFPGTSGETKNLSLSINN